MTAVLTQSLQCAAPEQTSPRATSRLTLRQLTRSVEGRVVYYADHPIRFAEFLDLSNDEGLELVQGVLEAKMAAQLTHEKLSVWLLSVLSIYTRRRNAGVVLGSRTPVEISEFSGRMPDLVFVRREQEGIVEEKAIRGTPDLVIELVSPNDRPSNLIALEADYRSLHIPEIVFIDSQQRQVRVVRLQAGSYVETLLTTGEWQSSSVPGFHVALTALFDEPRPDEIEFLTTLLANPLP